MSRAALSIFVTTLLAGCAASPAPHGLGAGSLKPDAHSPAEPVRYGGHPDYVTIESRYGHGRVSGPVRRGSRGGFEVRMPGGTWIDCGRNCAETLRRETVDFWESRGGRNDPIDGPGYLRWSW
jgi:hypothetical protein